MRFIRYAILAAIAVLLITLATANLTPVTIYLMPQDIALMVRYPDALNQITLPLFVVILAAVVLGAFLGYLTEYVREHKFRRESKQNRRAARKLSDEVKKLKSDKAKRDDVLALLDEPGTVR